MLNFFWIVRMMKLLRVVLYNDSHRFQKWILKLSKYTLPFMWTCIKMKKQGTKVTSLLTRCWLMSYHYTFYSFHNRIFSVSSQDFTLIKGSVLFMTIVSYFFILKRIICSFWLILDQWNIVSIPVKNILILFYDYFFSCYINLCFFIGQNFFFIFKWTFVSLFLCYIYLIITA